MKFDITLKNLRFSKKSNYTRAFELVPFLIFVFIVFLLVSAISVAHMKNSELLDKCRDIQIKIDNLSCENRDLVAEYNALLSDPLYVEAQLKKSGKIPKDEILIKE